MVHRIVNKWMSSKYRENKGISRVKQCQIKCKKSHNHNHNNNSNKNKKNSKRPVAQTYNPTAALT